MRWTSPIRLVFLMPAVLWVLAFTIVPLVYSLYAAFHNVTNETVVSRTEVPAPRQGRQPGPQAGRHAADEDRDRPRDRDQVGVRRPHQLRPHLQRPGGRRGAQGDRDLRRGRRVRADGARAGTGPAVQSRDARALVPAHADDPADLRHARWPAATCSSPSSTRRAARSAGPASPGCRTRAGPWSR